MTRASVIVVAILIALACTVLASPTHTKYPGDGFDVESLPKHEDGDPLFPRSIVTDVPKPSTPFPYALLLTENSCKLRKQFAKVRDFVATELPYYFQVKTKLTGGLPRVRFFKNKEDWEHNTVDAHEMTVEQMKELLQKLRENPDFNAPKGDTVEIQLSQETTQEDLTELLSKFGVPRDLTFHKERVPVIFEDDDDRPDNRKFDVDAVIKEVDPNAGPATITDEARAEAEELIRKEREERLARIEADAKAQVNTKTEL